MYLLQGILLITGLFFYSVEMVDAPPISSMEDIDENSYSEEEEDVCSVEERLRFKHRQRHGM